MSPRAAPPTRPCAQPDCPNPVIRTARRGRPPIYCSPTCRAQAKRRPATRPVLVEIDNVSPSTQGRPAGRVWLVRLRRGPQTVTVASGLGHTSAESLAAQITAILRTPSATPGAAID